MADTSNSVLFDAPGPKGRRTIRIVNWIAGILFAVVLVLILMRLHNPPDGENQLSWELWKPAVEREAWTDFYLPGLWMTIKATIVAVVGAVVRLAPEQAEAAQRAKKAADPVGTWRLRRDRRVLPCGSRAAAHDLLLAMVRVRGPAQPVLLGRGAGLGAVQRFGGRRTGALRRRQSAGRPA